MHWLAAWFLSVTLMGCSSSPPKRPDNICHIFQEKRHWYHAVKKAERRWGTPAHVLMAIMYQESSYKANARPPMRYFLGIIPIGRASSAYGYSQAKSGTWDQYRRETKRRRANRDNFADAVDFMGWFTAKTYKVNGVSKWDAYNQYLNYHEGWGGYQRGYHHKKAWLKRVAQRVDKRSKQYATQMKRCRVSLNRGWISRFIFG